MTDRFTQEISDYIRERIEQLNKKELESVIDECNSLTSTNCSWVRYSIRIPILEIAEYVLSVKEFKEDA